MNQNILIGLERQAEKLVLQIPAARAMVLQIPDAMDSNEYRSLFNEKFAELIVRECVDVELYWLSEQDRKAVAEKIKEHFGVEE